MLDKKNKQGAFKRRQHYYLEKELRGKAALFTLFILFGGLILQIIIKKLNTIIASPVLIPLVIIGYAVIILLCAIYFTHRFMGPFPRLAREMRQMMEQRDYAHKFHVRGKDDSYIQHFIDCVNQMTDHIYKENIEMRESTDSMLREVEILIRDISEGKANNEQVKTKLKQIHSCLQENKQKLI